MYLKPKNIVFFLLFASLGVIGKAQNAINISGMKVVAAGEVFTVSAGSTIIFEPGATLIVEGGLDIQGTESSPINIISKDLENPGRGIQILGWDEKSSINLKYVNFNGMIQGIRFDPFWYRNKVTVSNITFTNSNSGEPFFYVGNPTLDHVKASNTISFIVNNLEAVNNASGMFIESYNAKGIVYNLNNLSFIDNYINGGDESFGVLNLNFETGSTSTESKIGNVLLLRNFAGNTPLGVSVSGSANQSTTIQALFVENGDRLVYDQLKDSRIPSVNVEIRKDLNAFNNSMNLKGLSHTFGTVKSLPQGTNELVELRDSLGRLVECTKVRVGDTQYLNYIQGIPSWGMTKQGVRVRIPELKSKEISNVYVTKIDTAEYFKYLREKDAEARFYATHLVLDKYLTLPVFKRKGEILNKQKTWELGFWGGGSAYGGGDIKHKRVRDFVTTPDVFKKMWLVRDVPIFSTIELSRGIYAQYNVNQRFSARVNGYFSSVSMHNLYAPGLFGGGRITTAYDQDYNLLKFKPLETWKLNFYTQMFILEGEGLWHLRKNEIKQGKKGVWVPSIGLSAGLLYFTPYRFTYAEWDDNFIALRYRALRENRYNLRKVGSEGQFFLPNAEIYSPWALNIGTSFNLMYRMKKWSFKGEMKAVYTSTDYLDDFGPGLWYGGDINKLRQNVKIDEWNKPSDLYQITQTNDKIRSGSQRSVDGLNDWYFQAHLGVSYDITDFLAKRKKNKTSNKQ